MSATTLNEAPRTADLWALCDKIGQTAQGDTQTLACLLQGMSMRYYEDVRSQAKQSFRCALGAAIVGTAFFGMAAWPMTSQSSTIGNVGLVAGAVVSLISGVYFWLYRRAARQFSTFHVCLERANRFMLANTLVDNLCPDTRDALRAELIRIVATAPMLTLDEPTASS